MIRGSNGFKPGDRLLKRSEFLRLSRKGQRIHCRCFTGVVLPGTGGRSRLGITVSRKVGSAVVRNRIKRICRERFRTRRNLLPGAVDMNLIAKLQAGTSGNDELVRCLDQLFTKLVHSEPKR
ncbi:MAG: ribonuclease P protein component [Desulfobacterales bacterium]